MLPIISAKNISLQQLEWLEEVWEITTQELGVPESATKSIFEKIKNHHSESHRAYHNLTHIYSMLKMSEEFYDFIGNAELVDLSIWFHDIIYDATRQDNEAKSAELAIELLSPYLSNGFLKQLEQMILSTKSHTPTLPHHDNKLFLDLDLAILTTDKKTYQTYAEGIRAEYQIFPDEIYNAGRQHVLSSFLEKDNIYFTNFFQSKFETVARENITIELRGLEND